jgi:hypothetical protein
VRSPEEALAAARKRAQETRPAGGPALAAGPEGGLSADTQQDSLRRLATWAMIEPDESEVYSTRRLGAPVTLLKKLLVRLLRQYLDQVNAQQSRFNAHAVGHLIALEERVSRLEELARVLPEAPGTAGAERSTDVPPR